ncbi:MAG: trans-aconitate 2-methyltransferase [Rhizobiaceae bacterium]|nr:trans-aconitate 2-methyltransferase [Rhizobiaceae bacterium]
MAHWDPAQYLQFKKDRLRPAEELLGRIGIENPQLIVDLGCGPGTTTRLLGEKFGAATLVGVDNSGEMIAKAQVEYPRGEYLHCAVEEWKPDKRVDLIFANAVLHWVPNHQELIVKFAKALNAGGALAIQMPDNLDEPSHRAIAQVAGSRRWKGLLAEQLSARTQLSTAGEYYDWLARDFEAVDIWRTTYCHVMPGHEHIVEWVKGAALTPFLSVLNDREQEQFLSDYLEKIRAAYRVQGDGSVIYNFPRLFMTAIGRG